MTQNTKWKQKFVLPSHSYLCPFWRVEQKNYGGLLSLLFFFFTFFTLIGPSEAVFRSFIPHTAKNHLYFWRLSKTIWKDNPNIVLFAQLYPSAPWLGPSCSNASLWKLIWRGFCEYQIVKAHLKRVLWKLSVQEIKIVIYWKYYLHRRWNLLLLGKGKCSVILLEDDNNHLFHELSFY